MSKTMTPFHHIDLYMLVYDCTIQAKYITEAEEKYNQVLKALDPQLSLHYQRRCVEATEEGKSAIINIYSVWK